MDHQDYGSTVRNNLMKVPGYTPYCGADITICGMPRTRWDGAQFCCPHPRCNFRTQIPDDFMALYKARWPDGPGGVVRT